MNRRAASIDEPAITALPRILCDFCGLGDGLPVQEVRDKRSSGFFADLCRGTDLLDMPFIHNDDAIGNLNSFILVVCDEESGNFETTLQFLYPKTEFLTHNRVQGTEWLIQKEDTGLNSKRARITAAIAVAPR